MRSPPKGHPAPSAGVIWNGIPFETVVIPAKAGIQSVGGTLPRAGGVDSRFRGNDCTWEHPYLANDTSTPAPNRVDERSLPC